MEFQSMTVLGINEYSRQFLFVAIWINWLCLDERRTGRRIVCVGMARRADGAWCKIETMFIFLLSSNDSHSSSFLPCRRSRAGYCFLLVSASASSGNTSFSHTSRHPILTKLSHIDRYLNRYSRINNDGVRGQDGVTGFKKVIFTKKASSSTELVALTRDLRTCISLTLSTKFMVLKFIRGHLGSQGSKGHFHQKGIKSFRISSIDMLVTHMH